VTINSGEVANHYAKHKNNKRSELRDSSEPGRREQFALQCTSSETYRNGDHAVQQTTAFNNHQTRASISYHVLFEERNREVRRMRSSSHQEKNADDAGSGMLRTDREK
jgi:hypothetical protein